MSVDIKDENHVEEFLKKISDLESKTIEVGVLGGSNSKALTIAGVHEFGCDIEVTDKMRNYLHYIGIHLKPGTTKIKIPERSFIRAGFDKNKEFIKDQGEKLIEHVINGKISANLATQLLGEIARDAIQEYAVDLSDPPNADITVENKGSSNPLVDTGQMIDSIDWEVKG